MSENEKTFHSLSLGDKEKVSSATKTPSHKDSQRPFHHNMKIFEVQ